MEETKDVIQESSPEEVVEVISEDVKTPTESTPNKVDEKVVPYERFKKVNDELANLKNKKVVTKGALEVEDFIDISASLDGLDQREKSYLAEQHKLSGKPLKDIRNSEDFGLWQSAYRAKAEKERLTLAPSSKQSESERPKSLTQKLATASIADKEKILSEAGYYKSPSPKKDLSNIGR